LSTLWRRSISVVRDEYAVSPDGMQMFGVLDLETAFDGCRFAIGIRMANDKSMRLALIVRDAGFDDWRLKATSYGSAARMRKPLFSLRSLLSVKIR
jgi:hypothetical protein